MNKIEDKTSLFTEITAEEAADINGGGWVRDGWRWVWKKSNEFAEYMGKVNKTILGKMFGW
ncbi:MAG: hypothetical protein IGS23_02740 [Rivularia sp. T60_A2020_040]|nr:hypothetical protein [Rivularia sp. T60_A2020_040]